MASKNKNKPTFSPKAKQSTKVEEVKYPVEDFMEEKKKTEEVEESVGDIEFKTARLKDCSKLRLRTDKSTNADVLMVLDTRHTLTVIDYDPEAEWTQVVAINDDAFGDPAFVMTKFIEVI